MFLGLTGKNSGDTLKEMWCGMVLYGVIGQLVILFLIRGTIKVSLGWWLGVLIAMVCGYQMWWSLNKALDLNADDARKKMTAYSMFRYLDITVAMAFIMITEIVDPVAAVFGVFALKFGAYLQPFMHYLGKRFVANRK